MKSNHRRTEIVIGTIWWCGVAAFIAAILLYSLLGSSCENTFRRIVMKQAGSVGCFEFWFNRYQEFAVGILAIALGAVTAFFLIWQITEMTTGNEIARRSIELAEAAAQRVLRQDLARLGQAIAELSFALMELRDRYVANDDATAALARYWSAVRRFSDDATLVIENAAEQNAFNQAFGYLQRYPQQRVAAPGDADPAMTEMYRQRNLNDIARDAMMFTVEFQRLCTDRISSNITEEPIKAA